MSQSSALVNTLKKQLKASGKTYRDVAKCLDLSEPSVKRLFAEENFTLQRLEAICQLIKIDFSELVQTMLNDQQRTIQLSWEQEEKIASDLLLLMITVCVINGFTYENLLENYQITSSQVIQKLAVLDRLKIIELLPHNRIKLLVSPNFSWLPNGPIQRFFQDKVERDFFSTRFDQDTEQLVVINGLLFNASNVEFQKKMRRLANDFNELCQQDKSLPIHDRRGCTLVLALRHWQYSLFEQYAKSDSVPNP